MGVMKKEKNNFRMDAYWLEESSLKVKTFVSSRSRKNTFPQLRFGRTDGNFE